jgi:hypothetical protein
MARMERRGMKIRFWCKFQKERDNREDLEVDGRIILNSI